MCGSIRKRNENRFLRLVCLGLLSGCTAAAADIYFTNVPPYGTAGYLSGQVSGAAWDQYKVLVYIYVAGWWNKPTWAQPLTDIQPDGSWTCNITTGGESDTYAIEIIAFLVPSGSYQPSWEMAGQLYLPAELYAYPYADIRRMPGTRILAFAGHNWVVKFGNNLGPGPNTFSDSTENVWVDGNGSLHLKITHPDGRWDCSEIISQESFGYGTYVFTVESRVDLFDENIVLGLFTWDSYAPQYNYREIDFEFSRLTDPDNQNSQYVIQPWDRPGNLHRFDIDYPEGPVVTTHLMTWRADGIYFKSYYGDFSLAPPPETIIQDWYYTGSYNPPPGGENVRMNYWLILGMPPTDGLESEAVIRDFQFLTDISDQPGDINDDGRVDLADFAQIAAHWLNDTCGVSNTWCGGADLTCGGTVDLQDLSVLIPYWLQP